jgi:hypothetical protein
MLSIRTISSAVLRRFLPACGAVFLVILAGGALMEPSELSAAALAVTGVLIVTLTGGFWAGASILSHRLDATLSVGRRCVVAGLVSPLALGAVSVFTQGATMTSVGVLGLSAGVLMGLTVFGWAAIKGRALQMAPEVQAELERLDAELSALNDPAAVYQTGLLQTGARGSVSEPPGR